jgi:cytosine deaminase
MTRTLLRAVRPLGGATTDVLIEDGRFAAFGSTPGTADDVIDGGDLLMLPGLIESHAHIDKTLWGEPWRSNSAGPTLTDLIENERRVLRTVTTPTASRAEALVRHYVAMGATRIRTHVDVDPDTGLASVEALLGLRERLRDLVDIELVAFPQRGMLITPGTADLMDAAIGLGVETIGGIDPAGIDRDPIRHLETIFAIAERRGCAVDIHLHDGGELGAWQIDRIVDFVAAAGLQGRAMISHAYCLGEVPSARQEAIGRRLADQRIALMTTAPSDSALPPVPLLRALGVTVCLGNDGIRDAWSPFGNGDMLERAMLLAYRFYWAKDAELDAALACVTTDAARALGLADYGLAVGKPADFVLVRAETVGEAIVARPPRALVAKCGRIIARDGTMAV